MSETNNQEELRKKLHMEAKQSKAVQSLQDALGSGIKSINWGVIGWGQGGSRLAEEFYQFGYPVCVGNTAKQDLTFINVPEENKLFLDFALGGAGKDLELGDEAIRSYQDEVMQLMQNTFGEDTNSIVVCIGGGGGTGAGGAPALIELASQFGLPVVVLYTLPMQNEGVVTKSNAIKTLEQISKLAQSDVVSSLIIVDNSRIEEMYPSISAGHFWKVANFEIASTLHTFNTLSSCDTKYVALDPMDFAKIFTTGSCTIFGRMKMNLDVDDNGKLSIEDDEIANSVTENLHKGMLAQGFDLTETIRAGVMLTGRDEVLEQIPQININYAFAELNDLVDGADVFRGVYTDSDAENTLNVLSIFSGLGLPRERVSNLISESKQQMEQMQAKEGNRSRMNVFDAPSVSTEQDKYKQMSKKKSPFAKMTTKARGRG